MQKINSTSPSPRLGSLLRDKLAKLTKTATTDRPGPAGKPPTFDLGTPAGRIAAAVAQIKVIQTSGKKPAPADMPQVPQVRQPRPYFNADDPRHVQAQIARESAAARDQLLVAIRAAQKPSHGSTGPEAL